MKSVWPWIFLGICLILGVWTHLNTYFIKNNTKRIEKLEKSLPKTNVDTICINLERKDTIYISNLNEIWN